MIAIIRNVTAQLIIVFPVSRIISIRARRCHHWQLKYDFREWGASLVPTAEFVLNQDYQRFALIRELLSVALELKDLH